MVLGRILGNIGGMGSRGNSGLQPFRRVLHTDDWFSADVTAQPSQWNKVGEYTVQAQQEATFGINDPVGGSSIAGHTVYLRFDTIAGVQLQGRVRFAITNANETNTVVVMEERTNRLSADQSDRTKSVLLPEYPTRAKEDSKLQVLFYPDSASAVTIDQSATNTLLLIPVTIYQ